MLSDDEMFKREAHTSKIVKFFVIFSMAIIFWLIFALVIYMVATI